MIVNYLRTREKCEEAKYEFISRHVDGFVNR